MKNGMTKFLMLIGLLLMNTAAIAQAESLKLWHTSSIEDALLEEELPGNICEQLTDLKGDLDQYQLFLSNYNIAYKGYSDKEAQLKSCLKKNNCTELESDEKLLNCTFNHCEQELSLRDNAYDEQRNAKGSLDNYKVGIMELSSDIKNNCQVLSNRTCSVCQGMGRRPANYEI